MVSTTDCFQVKKVTGLPQVTIQDITKRLLILFFLLKHFHLLYVTNIQASLCFLHYQTIKRLPTVQHNCIMTTVSRVVHSTQKEKRGVGA